MADARADRKVGQGQVLGDLDGQIHRRVKAGAFDDVLGKAKVNRRLPLIDATGQDHVDHARFAHQFQTAADHRALQRRDDRHAAVFHLVERLVPAQADLHEIGRTAVGLMMFDQVQPGAEMIAGPGQNVRPDARARVGCNEIDQLFNRGQIKRVAFGRAVQRAVPDPVDGGRHLPS